MGARELFLAALELHDLRARALYLDQACSGDAALRARVEALLKSHEEAGSFLEEPATYDVDATVDSSRPKAPSANIAGDPTVTASGHSLAPTRPDSDATGANTPTPVADSTAGFGTATGFWTPDVDSPTQSADGHSPSRVLPRGTSVRYFGDYEVQREIGRGGMGVVYQARQVSLNRPVALKMIKAGVLADEAELRRFQNEAEAVALLDHAGIVPVYEVGEHDGQRYFSMKLVEGDNLSVRLASFKNNPKAAASLLAEAAEAVHHAHMRGILHRDLKPANILVDAEGHPHVTDFGLAKRVEGDIELTEPGAILGTPAYMSPEQANARRGSITTATDVYGLGAILYALVTSKAPFGGDSVMETLDAVRNQPPEPPTKFNSHVPRDLETICLKCLEKDPRRRYAAAQALADDLRAWLDSRPIAARRVGATERAWLWCRRRPAVAALTVAVTLAVGGGVATVIAVQSRANTALKAANAREKQRFNLAMAAIKLFHGEVSDDLVLKADEFKPLRDKLLQGAADFYGKLEGLLKDQPDRASRTAMGNAYFELGELTSKIGDKPAALASHRKGLAVRRELALAPNVEGRVDLAKSLFTTGALLNDMGNPAEALASYEKSLDLLQGLPLSGPGSDGRRSLIGNVFHSIGWVLSSTRKKAEAMAAYERSIETLTPLAEANPAVTEFRRRLATTYCDAGLLQSETGELVKALDSYRRAAAILRKLAADNPAVTEFRRGLAITYHNLGNLQFQTGRPVDALESYQQSLPIFKKLAADNPAVTDFRSNLAATHRAIGLLQSETGGYLEALESYKPALAIYQKLAHENPKVTDFQRRLASTHQGIGLVQGPTGKPVDASESYRRALVIFQKLADDNPTVPEFPRCLAAIHHDIGLLQSGTGKPLESLQSFRRALVIFQKLADDNPSVTDFRRGLAATYHRIGAVQSPTGKSVEALESYGQALAIFQKLADDNVAVAEFRSRLAATQHDIGGLLWEIGKTDEALESFQRVEAINQKLADDSPNVTAFQRDLAKIHHDAGFLRSQIGKPAEGLESYRKALALSRKLVEDNPAVTEFASLFAFIQDSIGFLKSWRGEPVEALESCRRALAIFQKLADDNPNVTDFRSGLANTLCHIGLLQLESGQLVKALASNQRAIAIYQRLADENPTVFGYRYDLACSLTILADVHRSLSHTTQARAGYDRAISMGMELVTANPEIARYRSGLAASVRRLGQLRLTAGDSAGAVADARKAVALFEGLPSRSGEEQYELACCHAALAAAARPEGSGISTGEAEAESVKSIALLRKAVTEGYRNTDAMTRESALDSLRNRPDFQLLMRDLIFLADPFAQ
jgi:eukaryotic-like serine/threonine-protein kinase